MVNNSKVGRKRTDVWSDILYLKLLLLISVDINTNTAITFIRSRESDKTYSNSSTTQLLLKLENASLINYIKKGRHKYYFVNYSAITANLFSMQKDMHVFKNKRKADIIYFNKQGFNNTSNESILEVFNKEIKKDNKNLLKNSKSSRLLKEITLKQHIAKNYLSNSIRLHKKSKKIDIDFSLMNEISQYFSQYLRIYFIQLNELISFNSDFNLNEVMKCIKEYFVNWLIIDVTNLKNLDKEDKRFVQQLIIIKNLHEDNHLKLIAKSTLNLYLKNKTALKKVIK